MNSIRKIDAYILACRVEKMPPQQQQHQRRPYRPSSPFPNLHSDTALTAANPHPVMFRESTRRKRTLMIDNVQQALTSDDILKLVAPCTVLRMKGLYRPKHDLQSLQLTFSDSYDPDLITASQPFGATQYQDPFPVMYNRINEFAEIWTRTSYTWKWRRASRQQPDRGCEDAMDHAETLYRQTSASEERLHYKKLKQRMLRNRYNVPTVLSSSELSDGSCSDHQERDDVVSPVDSLFQYYLDSIN